MKFAILLAVLVIAALGYLYGRYESLDPCVMVQHDLVELAQDDPAAAASVASELDPELAKAFARNLLNTVLGNDPNFEDRGECVKALVKIHITGTDSGSE